MPHIDYDAIAAEYARHRQVHPAVLQALCQVIDLSSRVLEVGCGTGNYIVALQSVLGCACWGIDPSAEMLARARARSPAVRFQIGRAEALGFQPACFDLVFSVDVVHHIDDRLAYFAGAHQVLRPGGYLCTVTDSEWVIRHRQPMAVYFPETVEGELRRYPPIADLCRMMAQAGFEQTVEGMVEHPYALTDIGPYRDKAFSALHLIPEEAFRRGLERMERDMQTGPIPCVSRYTLVWGKSRQGSGYDSVSHPGCPGV